MNESSRWILAAFLAGAAAGAAFVLRSRHLQHRVARALQHKTHLQTWEGEGGNLAPPLQAKPL